MSRQFETLLIFRAKGNKNVPIEGVLFQLRLVGGPLSSPSLYDRSRGFARSFSGMIATERTLFGGPRMTMSSDTLSWLLNPVRHEETPVWFVAAIDAARNE